MTKQKTNAKKIKIKIKQMSNTEHIILYKNNNACIKKNMPKKLDILNKYMFITSYAVS